MIVFLIIIGVVLLWLRPVEERDTKPVPPAPLVIREPKPKNTNEGLLNIETVLSDKTAMLTLTLNEQAFREHLKRQSQPHSPGYMLIVEDIVSFHGRKSNSSDGHYIVVAADGYSTSSNSHTDQLAFIRDGKLLFKTSLQRPNGTQSVTMASASVAIG